MLCCLPAIKRCLGKRDRRFEALKLHLCPRCGWKFQDTGECPGDPFENWLLRNCSTEEKGSPGTAYNQDSWILKATVDEGDDGHRAVDEKDARRRHSYGGGEVDIQFSHTPVCLDEHTSALSILSYPSSVKRYLNDGSPVVLRQTARDYISQIVNRSVCDGDHVGGERSGKCTAGCVERMRARDVDGRKYRVARRSAFSRERPFSEVGRDIVMGSRSLLARRSRFLREEDEQQTGRGHH